MAEQNVKSYKIVQTIENGSLKISAVPSCWERNGKLSWPPEKLLKSYLRSHTLPGTLEEGWTEFMCIVKRSSIYSYIGALKEVENMSNNSDTDIGLPSTPILTKKRLKTSKNVNPDNDRINFNKFLPETKTANTNSPQPYSNLFPTEESLPSTSSEPSKRAILLTLLENQSKITMALEHVIKSQQTVLEKIEKLEASLRSVVVSTPRKDVPFNLIDTIEDCRLFEENLRESYYEEELLKSMESVCKTKNGLYGDNVPYIFVDHVFTRRFFTLVTWTGISRTPESKECFQTYERVFKFFFDLVRTVDPQYTITGLKQFFIRIISNSKRRFEHKGSRTSRIKIRHGMKRKKESSIEEAMVDDQKKNTIDDVSEHISVCSRKQENIDSEEEYFEDIIELQI